VPVLPTTHVTTGYVPVTISFAFAHRYRCSYVTFTLTFVTRCLRCSLRLFYRIVLPLLRYYLIHTPSVSFCCFVTFRFLLWWFWSEPLLISFPVCLILRLFVPVTFYSHIPRDVWHFIVDLFPVDVVVFVTFRCFSCLTLQFVCCSFLVGMEHYDFTFYRRCSLLFTFSNFPLRFPVVRCRSFVCVYVTIYDSPGDVIHCCWLCGNFSTFRCSTFCYICYILLTLTEHIWTLSFVTFDLHLPLLFSFVLLLFRWAFRFLLPPLFCLYLTVVDDLRSRYRFRKASIPTFLFTGYVYATGGGQIRRYVTLTPRYWPDGTDHYGPRFCR